MIIPDWDSNNCLKHAFVMMKSLIDLVAVIETWVSRLMLGLIAFYRSWISPMIGPRCRFIPTCSAYGLEAIERHGPWRGGWLTLRRFLRCHPFTPCGCDPVPD